MSEKHDTKAAASSFEQLGIHAAAIQYLRGKGITEPALIQREAIPPLLAGKEAIIHSGTGTGKTLAYVLPLTEHIDLESKQLQGLIIVPTQELAMQIVREIEGLTGSGKVAALIGGASLQRQVDRLKQHQPIAVGTPGRLVELWKMKKLKLAQLAYVVIDEVDQVLSLGAAADVDTLLTAIPKERQLIYVTATVTEEVKRSAERWMREYETLSGQTQAQSAAAVVHEYMICEYREKVDAIRRFVRTVKPDSALIFVKDADIIGELEAKLKFAGLQVESLYGDAGKQERATVMQRFVSGKLKLLIATDVAARGIDVPRISHVLNFEPPIDPKQYIHRSGRTGRMGRSGTVVTLATFGERALLKKIAAKLGIALKEKALSHGEWVDAQAAGTGVLAPAGGSQAHKRKTKPVSRKEEPQHARTAAKPEPERKRGKERDRKRERDRKNKGAPRWLKAKRAEADKE